jgi:hypothetical protein
VGKGDDITMVYLISYDLIEKPEESYEKLFDVIKSCKDYRHPLKSQWFIASARTATEIYNSLAAYVMKNDRLFVNEITPNRCGWLSTEDVEWLNKHGA